MNAIRVPLNISPAARGAAYWVGHFRENVYREWRIPWDASGHLPLEVHRRIVNSIAEFQRGESSEAVHYLEKSRAFAAQTGDAAFHDASILFVREENGHAALLLRFMRQVGIASRERALTDEIFRWLRGRSDLGWSSRVLLIAELIAQEYYPCLRVATDHPALRRICDRIICDEEAHIGFQVERIARLESGRSRMLVGIRDLAQIVLMAGTAVVVFWGHRRVLRMRMRLPDFAAAVLRRNQGTLRAMAELRSGECSAWPAAGESRGAALQRIVD